MDKNWIINNYDLKDLSNEESEIQNKKTIDLSNSELEETSNTNEIMTPSFTEILWLGTEGKSSWKQIHDIKLCIKRSKNITEWVRRECKLVWPIQ